MALWGWVGFWVWCCLWVMGGCVCVCYMYVVRFLLYVLYIICCVCILFCCVYYWCMILSSYYIVYNMCFFVRVFFCCWCCIFVCLKFSMYKNVHFWMLFSFWWLGVVGLFSFLLFFVTKPTSSYVYEQTILPQICVNLLQIRVIFVKICVNLLQFSVILLWFSVHFS